MSIAHSDVKELLRRRGYQELKKVGEGSFGKALLVQAGDGTRLICKMVDVSKASAREMQDAVREGQLLAELRHPYIVRYKESFTESGWLCILMDYCEGGDLTKRIEEARKKRTPISEAQVLRWFVQGVLALKYIHEKHILHRDLKPGNFFLSKNGSMKMGDFGIAKVLACTIAVAKTQIGTPYYLSPELCQEKPYTWPSDIWAMGCILFELCALKVPFDAPNIPGLVQKIIRAPVPPLPSGYSSFLRQLCNEMLDRNPDRRPSPDDILARTQIQAVVKQMLEEAQAANETVISENENEKLPAHLACPQPLKVEGPYADKAGNYRVNDLIEYYSSSHSDWLPATVTKINSEGSIIIDLKPNTWIVKADQAGKVRPRAAKKPVERPASRAASPMARSPSVGRFAAPPSPMRARSPSVGGSVCGREAPARAASPRIRRSPSPFAAAAAAGFAAPAGSRSDSDSRAASPMLRQQSPSVRSLSSGYKRGDLVEYWSVSHNEWLPAEITNMDAEGRVIIDLKPNTWLSKEDQAARMRPRVARAVPSTPGRAPSVNKDSPMVRQPSAGGFAYGGGYAGGMTPGRAASPRRDSSREPPGHESPCRRGFDVGGTPRVRPPHIPPGIPKVCDSPLRQGGRLVAGM